jgi:hypothetical protein
MVTDSRSPFQAQVLRATKHLTLVLRRKPQSSNSKTQTQLTSSLRWVLTAGTGNWSQLLAQRQTLCAQAARLVAQQLAARLAARLAGGSLMISAGTQPANSLAPAGASRVPFTTFMLTNNERCGGNGQGRHGTAHRSRERRDLLRCRPRRLQRSSDRHIAYIRLEPHGDSR